jgi:hypothetical protein
MSNVTEKLSSSFLGKVTESPAYGYLDNSEFDIDTLEPVGSEESDTDASTDSTGNNLENIEKLASGAKGDKNDPTFNARRQNDQFGDQVADYETEITFLKLKMKLLIKESNEEYNEVHFFISNIFPYPSMLLSMTGLFLKLLYTSAAYAIRRIGRNRENTREDKPEVLNFCYPLH